MIKSLICSMIILLFSNHFKSRHKRLRSDCLIHLLQEDQSRPFLVSSPTNGVESEQEGWVAANPYDPVYGDTHFYSYILDCWDWRTFPRTRFASEYGFQSWPSFSALQPVTEWTLQSCFLIRGDFTRWCVLKIREFLFTGKSFSRYYCDYFVQFFKKNFIIYLFLV